MLEAEKRIEVDVAHVLGKEFAVFENAEELFEVLWQHYKVERGVKVEFKHHLLKLSSSPQNVNL